MASTYTPIATYTTSNNTTTQINFSSFSGYTDLVLVQALPNDPNGTYGYSNYRFNSDTGTNYSSTYGYNYNGVTAGRQANVAYLLNGTSSYMSNCLIITQIQNYSNTSTYKPILTRALFSANSGGTVQEEWMSTGQWRSNSAITSIQVYTGATGYSTGSTFTLYGILAA